MSSLLWTFLEISVNFFEAFIYLYFFKNRINVCKKSTAADAICLISYTAFLSLYLFFYIPFPDSFGGVIFAFYLHYVSDERWSACILWVIFKEVIVIATIGLMLQIFLSVLSVPYDLILAPTRYRLVYILSTNFVLFIEMFFFSRAKAQYSSLHWSALLIFVALNVSLLIIIEILFSIQIQQLYSSDIPFFISYALLIFCATLSAILFHLMTSISAREHQAEIALNHIQLTEEHQLVIQDMYADILKQKHDIKHQLQVIEQLVASNNSASAQQYLDEYKAKMPQKDDFLTGSISVDALLTAKSLACKHHNISLHVFQCPLNSLPISEVDFCTILGNLLDNAIEGNDRIVNKSIEKWINLSFSRVWDMFTIRCENPVNPTSIKRHQSKFVTSKRKSPEIHGFGIPNIISIAENADGFCSFDIENNQFVATVTLPYPIKKEL